MGYKVIYDAPIKPKPHVCDLPDVMTYETETIIECDCGQQYQLHFDGSGRSWYQYSSAPV